MKAELVARLDRGIRPYITQFAPPYATTFAYSAGRHAFLEMLQDELPPPYEPPAELSRTLWGIRFRSPIMNAAGMFKNGECYYVVERQGAGGYEGGTTTALSRSGNKKHGIRTPFVPLPHSHAGLNWLGLNNYGDKKVSEEIKGLKQVDGCPVVMSLAESPDLPADMRMPALVRGMHLYKEAGVKVIEVNKSCPNTGEEQQFGGLRRDLVYVKDHFIDEQDNVRVVVKPSNDTPRSQVPQFMDMLFELGYHGVNFGNTSTVYQALLRFIDPKDRKLFDYFTKTFGGGLSGRGLKDISLALCDNAAMYLRAGPPQQEFHVWRTGGIENARDIRESDDVGVSMNLWFTGNFEAFARDGHNLYKNLYTDYLVLK